MVKITDGGARVLLADGSTTVRTALAIELERQGFHIRQAEDGHGALTIARSGWPQALVLDAMMTSLDGLTVLRHLRAEAATAALPVLLLTGMEQSGARADALGHGAADYLTKPADPDEISARLLRLLRNAAPVDGQDLAARLDPLTGLLGRRGLDEAAQRLVRQALERRQELACLCFSLDHVEAVAGLHGRSVGDAMLIEAAARLRRRVRSGDYAGRYGGAELMVLVPGVGWPRVLVVAERIRLAIADGPVATPAGPVPLAVSAGGALLSRVVPASWEGLLAQAATALLQARRSDHEQVLIGAPPASIAGRPG